MASLLKNVGANLLGFMAGKAAAAVTGVLLLRALRPEAAGIYGAALGFAGLFQCLADLGLSACLTKEVGAQHEHASQFFSRGLQAQALQIAVAAVALGAFLEIGGSKGIEPKLVFLAFALMSLNSLSSPTLAVLQGLERFGLQGILTTMASLLNALALALVLLLGQANPKLALQASLGASILALIIWWGGAWATGLRFRFEAWSSVINLWRKSLPFALVSVTNQLYIRVDLALLAWLASPVALGFYVAAAKLVDLMVPVLGALNGPLYSRLSSLHSRAALGDRGAGDQAQGNLNRALRFMALICLPIGVGGSLLAVPLCRFVFGVEFTAAAPALAFLVWVPALIGIHGCLLHGLNAVGHTLRLAQVFGANLVLNIGLNIWLIPQYGIVASAGISALCECVNLGAAWALARQAGLAPSLKDAFWPVVPAALAMGLVLILMRPYFESVFSSVWLLAPALVFLGALAYSIILILFGFLGADERAQIQRIFKRS